MYVYFILMSPPAQSPVDSLIIDFFVNVCLLCAKQSIHPVRRDPVVHRSFFMMQCVHMISCLSSVCNHGVDRCTRNPTPHQYRIGTDQPQWDTHCRSIHQQMLHGVGVQAALRHGRLEFVVNMVHVAVQPPGVRQTVQGKKDDVGQRINDRHLPEHVACRG